MKTLGKIENNCQLNPLKELWLGGIYPESFYSHFDNKTEDLFCKITELTNKDLIILKTFWMTLELMW